MKGIFLLVLVLALCLLAAGLAPVFLADPGMVHIRLRGWTVEMSLLVLVFGVLFACLVIYLTLRIWRMPAETARRVRERRALAQLEKGLLALTEGDWTTAEKALRRSTSTEGRSTARYLAAAQAADGQQAGARAAHYLEQADSGGRRSSFLVELTRARLLTENGRYAEAAPILEMLHRKEHRHHQVLELLARCYQSLEQWPDLQRLLPVMIRTGVMDRGRADHLRREAAQTGIRRTTRADQLPGVWQKLPKALRQTPAVARTFANQAIRLGVAELSEPVLRASLKQQWDSSLLVPYAAAGTDDAAQRMKQCEQWLEQHPQDAALHLALGRLCARESLWGKARHHMVRSLEIEPAVGGYDSLGQLLERQGELELAMACFRNALRMSQGEQPLPLPGGIKRLDAPPLNAGQ